MEHELGLKTKPDDWMLTTLGEYLDSTGGSIQTGPFGSQLHASDYVEVGTPSVMPKNISVEGINTDDIAKVSDNDMQRLSKYHLESGDIVYSRRGDVEKCALVKEQEAGWLCGTGCLRVRLGSSDNAVSAEFLHAYLSSPMIREWISRNAVGATMPNLNTGILRDVPLLLPSVREAKGIGKSWATLNNKITLNRQINQTLEQMAQTLFKSWFVDFDPVMDNALDAGFFEQDWPIPDELQHRAEVRKAVRESEGFKPLPDDVRQLFPDAFEESELGWVPKGWGSGILSDLLVLQRGFDLPKSKRTDGQFPLMAASGQDGTHNEGKVRGPGVVTGRSGKLGVVNLVIEDFWPLNTTLWIKEYPRSNPYHAYFFLQTIPLEQFNSGSAVPTLNRNHVHNRPVTLPSQDVLNKYADLVKDNFIQILNRRIQSETLEKLRDTLLPKLISGELRLDDVELAVE